MSSLPLDHPRRSSRVARLIGHILLGGMLVAAGTGHLTFQREEFQAQVPNWFPVDADTVVLVSGVAEILLGGALIAAPRKAAPRVGLLVAAFFIVIFPGNVAQWLEAKDGFGLDTDQKRLARLFFQPVLVLAALWSTNGWRWLRHRRTRD